MVREMWGSFPRLIEENVNGLLDRAQPNATKAFMIYKTCRNEGLWSGSYDEFARHLENFYEHPRAQRKKGDFDRVLDRPMDQHLFGEFHVTFRTARISDEAISDLASWTYNVLKFGKKTNSPAASFDVMESTLRKLVSPRRGEKEENFEFSDFCEAWEVTVIRKHGRKFENDFKEIVGELKIIDAELKRQASDPTYTSVYPTIYLTQTELDWTRAVRIAAEVMAPLPEFPLSKGPQKQLLMDLDRVVTLYSLVYETGWPELHRHREDIRATVLDRCEKILGPKIERIAA